MMDRIVSDILKLLGDKAIHVLESINWEPIEQILRKLDKKRGRKDEYPKIARFKAILYCFAKGKRTQTAIARELRDNGLIKNVCGLSKAPSHDSIRDLWIMLPEVIEEIFQGLIRQIIELGIMDGKDQAIDSTRIETKFLSDKDAKWSYDNTRKEFYFGYGLLLMFDVKTHLPTSAIFTQSKKVNQKQAKKCYAKALIKPKSLSGDGEFDMIDLHKYLIRQGTTPIIPYNPRNGEKKMKYRIQQFDSSLSETYLDAKFLKREEAEHGIATLKERFGLENFNVKGKGNVKVHVFLCLINRLADALAVHKNYPDCPVRKSILFL